MTPKNIKPNIAIIGAGSLGVGLAQLFLKNGYVVVLGSRKPESNQEALIGLVTLLNTELIIKSPEDAVQNADITLLTVADDAIETVCDSLAPEFKKGSVVAHCSGALDSNILVSAKTHGCKTCSLHPLNSFPSIASAIQTLNSKEHNTYIYCEGVTETLDSIVPHFEIIGFNHVTINQQDKALYHAACVFASNYLTTLIDISLQTAETAHIDQQQFWQSLQPLINSTLSNVKEYGVEKALSGPIARGDTNTIAKHIDKLEDHNLDDIYINLGKYALELAIKRGELQPEVLDKLTKLLDK